MDGYTFRAHLNAVIIMLRALAEDGQLPRPEQVRQVTEYLAGVELMSGAGALALDKALHVTGTEAPR